MGIVVCIVMLMGLVVLRPTPWRSDVVSEQASGFVFFTAAVLFFIGGWNVIYGLSSIKGFWCFASLVSGIAMIVAAFFTLLEKGSRVKSSLTRKTTVLILALSFVLYAVTLIQLNLGYPIL